MPFKVTFKIVTREGTQMSEQTINTDSLLTAVDVARRRAEAHYNVRLANPESVVPISHGAQGESS